MPNPTKHFEKLGAPLRNRRWSWGAKRQSGTVILRAWDDEVETIGGQPHIRLTNHRVYDGTPHPGFRERLRHIQDVREGASGYVVICKAVKPTPGNRRLKSFDDRTLTKIAGVTNHGRDEWAKLGEKIPVAQLKE